MKLHFKLKIGAPKGKTKVLVIRISSRDCELFMIKVYLKFLSSFISNKKYANETNFTTNLPLCGVKETINPDGP